MGVESGEKTFGVPKEFKKNFFNGFLVLPIREKDTFDVVFAGENGARDEVEKLTSESCKEIGKKMLGGDMKQFPDGIPPWLGIMGIMNGRKDENKQATPKELRWNGILDVNEKSFSITFNDVASVFVEEPIKLIYKKGGAIGLFKTITGLKKAFK